MANNLNYLNSIYKIEGELGSGGGGVVYKAWHTHLQKYVVIKELKRGTKDNVETQRNEVEALKNVKSIYLPQVLDFFVENDRVYTVMEFIDGTSLDKLLAKNYRFTQQQVVKWYAQLAAALEVIHKQNIAHRDIKPANIMLLPDGNVCLIDFNAALVGESDVRLISRSLGYASPEQYQIYENYKNASHSPIRLNTISANSSSTSGFKTQFRDDRTELVDSEMTELVDSQSVRSRSAGNPEDATEILTPRTSEEIDWKLSDVYSLGATMYHLLTGIRPAERADETPKLSSVGEFDEGLTYIIESSMMLNPLGRINSAESLSYAIRNIYKYDKRWRNLQRKQLAASVILPLTLAGCLATTALGFNKMVQEKEELYYSTVLSIEKDDDPNEAYKKSFELFEDRVDPYCAMAQRLWNDGDLTACKEYIRENLGELTKFQTDENAKDALGKIYYIFGDCFYYDSPDNDYQNAKLNYALALNHDPSNPIYHRDYAITLARLGDINGAKEELKKAQLLKLDDVSLNLLNGEIDYASKKYSSAIKCFSEVISTSEDDYIRYRAYHSSDEIFKLQGKIDESVELLSDCLTKIPLNRVNEMQERLADSCYKIGDNKKAIKIFESLVEKTPTYNMQQNLVILYQNENEFDKAAALLDKMAQQFPDDYRVPMRRAFLETDIQAHTDNEKRSYSKTVAYYNQAKAIYEKNVKPGETDPEMQQLEGIIQQLKDKKWID